jgi:hypothetical protein
MIIDAFGKEYGYTPEQTLGMPIIGVFRLIERINARYSTKKGGRHGQISIGELSNLMEIS